MVSEADRLAASGAFITIQDRALRVRFGFASLRYLEREYGGLDVFWARLGEAGFGATRIDTIFNGLVAGLLDIKPDDQDIEEFKRELETDLEPKELLQYLEAVMTAFEESIPKFENGSVPKGKRSRGNSRGRASTTSRQSGMAGVNENSGE